MYRRLAMFLMFVAVGIAVMVYSGVDEYARSGQFPWGAVVVSIGMLALGVFFAMKSSESVDRFGNTRSERLVNRDWQVENRRRQMRQRQAALRDTLRSR